MSDVLSNYYNAYYNKKNTFNIKENFFTPNKNIKNKKDSTSRNLSLYGLYFSGNNTLLISKKNKILPLTLSINKYMNLNKFLSSEKNLLNKNINKIGKKLLTLKSKKNNDKRNFESFKPPLKQCFSYKNQNEILLDKIDDIKKEEKLQNINIKSLIISKNNNNKKSRNKFSEFYSLKSDHNNYPSSTSNYIRTSTSLINSSRPENKTYYKTIEERPKEKRLFYRKTKKEKMDNELEAQKIIKELLSLKTKKDIKSYYIKKDHAKAVAEATNNENNHFNIHDTINPMSYIKLNFKNEPTNNNLFSSYDTQLMVMGNQKYRNDLLEGVNEYKNNWVKYEDLKGPIGFDKNKINEKKRNEIIKKMENNFSKRRGLIFSKRLYKGKGIKMSIYEFDENYKDMKNLLYKNLDKYETNIKFENGKRVPIKVDKNDINILKKINEDAEFLIEDKDEMIKYSHRFLSFDEKINKLLSKTKSTTEYLSHRADEHSNITKKIDQLYNNF